MNQYSDRKSDKNQPFFMHRRQVLTGSAGVLSAFTAGLAGLWLQRQSQSPPLGAWAVGIGENPERYLLDVLSDPLVAEIETQWKPHFLTAWVNSFDHIQGDLSYWRRWFISGLLKDWFERGYGLHIITWENDEQLPTGDYHISPQFVQDMVEIAEYIALSNPKGLPTYWTLATEFSYWRVPADTYNPDTQVYYQALMANVLHARLAIKEVLPNAWVTLSWGGWIATFDKPDQGSGRSMVAPFAETMSQMDGIAFQSMRPYRAFDLNPDVNHLDPGNPEQVRLCCELFSPINPDLMLAHYEPYIKANHPLGGRPETVVADFQVMSNPGWLTYLSLLGLRKISLMHYTLYKGDPEQALSAAQAFRAEVRKLQIPKSLST
jgi:hypothetical protein